MNYLAPLLRINTISLVQFKNYRQTSFRFDERIIGISGPNGVGKTNLLDAIYYLCFTKSYFSRTDTANVHTGSMGFRIEGNCELDGEKMDIVCILRETGRKEFQLNGEAYDKFSAHIGKFPCVIIAPDDISIITEASDQRRRFLDALLSQLDAAYLQHLIDYNKVLQQRNTYLRSLDRRSPDLNLIEVYDSQMVKHGSFIYNTRKNFLAGFTGEVKQFYSRIAGVDEPVDIGYKSQLHETSFEKLLLLRRDKDVLLQRTNGGIHRDDLHILLKDQPFKEIASQGQRKSLLFALKLAEFETLKKAKGFSPFLLLDDVFEKLDASRMHNLLEWVCLQNEGQIFITDTHKNRIQEHFETIGVRFQVVEL